MIDKGLDDIELNLEFILGSAEISLDFLNNLKEDDIVSTEISTGEPTFLLVSGEPIARGDIMLDYKDINFRITKIFDSNDAIRFSKDYFGT